MSVNFAPSLTVYMLNLVYVHEKSATVFNLLVTIRAVTSCCKIILLYRNSYKMSVAISIAN